MACNKFYHLTTPSVQLQMLKTLHSFLRSLPATNIEQLIMLTCQAPTERSSGGRKCSTTKTQQAATQVPADQVTMQQGAQEGRGATEEIGE
jgi:hypothetical protein